MPISFPSSKVVEGREGAQKKEGRPERRERGLTWLVKAEQDLGKEGDILATLFTSSILWQS